MTRRLNIKDRIVSAKGMTLIDLSIALVVLGLLMVPLAQVVKNRAFTDRDGNTRGNLATIETAMEQYYFANDSFPCPADPSLGPDDPDYGKSVVNTVDNAFPPCHDTIVTTPYGYYEGSVPFKDLKISAKTSLDGWQNKITYHVATDATRPGAERSSGNSGNGGYMLVRKFKSVNNPGFEDSCSPNYEDTDNVFWLLISSGMNGANAYTVDGTMIPPLTVPGGSGRAFEYKNHEGDKEFYDENCLVSTDHSEAYFDDIVTYSNRVPKRIWANSNPNISNMFSDVDLVGINNAEPEVDLDVLGNIRLSTDGTVDRSGKAKAEELCSNQGDCFKPEIVGGDAGALKCTNSTRSTAMSGIANGALCDIGFNTNYISGMCPQGSFMTGLKQDGTANCL